MVILLLAMSAIVTGRPARAVGIATLTQSSCDPKMQSCAPGMPLVPSPQSCGPAAGGAPACGNGLATLGNQSGTNQGAGNPINVITGNKYQREEDLPALPGVLGLEIVRHYNSAYSSPDIATGILGRGWKLSYETDLYAIGNTLQIVQADGTRIIFSRNADNRSLCSTADPAYGSLRIEPGRQGDGYVWTWTDGRELRFDNAGKLVQIAVPTGEFVSLQRDAKGVLLQVTDPQGRQLRLQYPQRTGVASNQFRGVASISSPVGVFTYQYGRGESQSAQSQPAGTLANLVKVAFPDDTARLYHYENMLRPTFLTGISIVDARKPADGSNGTNTGPNAANTGPRVQRIGTYLYDRNGRAILTVRGLPARLQTGKDGKPVQPARLVDGTGIGQVALDFTRPGTTILHNSLGQTTTYRHGIVAGQYRLLEVRGAGCSQCGEVDVRYAYDKLGRPLQTIRLDARGQPLWAMATVVDDLGRPLSVSRINYEKGKPGAPQLRLRYVYGPGPAAAPILIARPSVVPGREALTKIAYNDMGQVATVQEYGWMPALPGQKNAQPSEIHRSLTYRHALINGRSVLVAVNGPTGNAGSNGVSNDSRNSDFDSNVTRAGWDRQGNAIVSITVPGGFSSTVYYDGAGRIVSLTDAEGRKTLLTHDYRSRLLTSTQDGITHTIKYDADGNRVETGVIDSAGAGAYRPSVRLGYDRAGRNTWVASHLGIVARNRYDGEDNLLEATSESAHFRQLQQFAYDAAGRMMSSIDPAGGLRTIAWNDAGRPQAAVDALGRQTRFDYDATGNLHQVSAPKALVGVQEGTRTDAQPTTFEHDALGNTIAVIAPNGATTRYFRDDFGRTVAIDNPDSGIDLRRHDAAGRVIASSDARGNRATYDYDVAGRIVRQTVFPAQAADAAKPISTLWQYDGLHLAAVTHAGSTERYRHDAAGRLVGKTVEITPERANGNASSNDANGISIAHLTQYDYDAQGQLHSLSLPDGSTIAYQRNAQNQVTGIVRSRLQTTWLKWLLPAQPIVAGLERDIAGLKSFLFGNGVQARYQRSREGLLARIVYRQPDSPGSASRQDAVSAARLAEKIAYRPILPGAIGLPEDGRALVDHRYLWDSEGNLRQSEDRSGATLHAHRYAYDAQDRLIASANLAGLPARTDDTVGETSANADSTANTASTAGTDSTGTTSGALRNPSVIATYDRYFHDGVGNRLLSQEGIANQRDLFTGTIKSRYEAATNRALTSNDNGVVNLDAAGEPVAIGQRQMVWDAFGKLAEVRQDGTLLASYRYDGYGRRIAKRTQRESTHYLYEDRKLVAELDDDGKIVRQYLYLAEQPIAVIDTTAGIRPWAGAPGFWRGLWHDLVALRQAWFSQDESIAYLHNNHLGATELITNDRGQPVWAVAYSPYGAVRMMAPAKTSEAASMGRGRFAFNLRFPGQYADAETGLYYNDHRYYDPQRGRYLTPDPLGLRGGVNSYAYVANNPLKNIDPSGLILFAFDGTGNNSRDNSKKIDSSNVALLYRFYDQTVAQQNFAEYQRGVGTDPTKWAVTNLYQMAFAQEANSLIEGELVKFHEYLGGLKPQETITLDVIGFSRGAAEARDFSNRIRAEYKENKVLGHCIEFRFLGLFDTVSQMGLGGSLDQSFDFSIAPEWQSVAQAYALNEHRAQFPLRSIQGAAAPYIEKGFVGSHSDIGGGYLEKSEEYPGDLSDVALMWMVQQAEKAGIKFTTIDDEFRQVTRPVVHDERNTSPVYGKRYTTPMYAEAHDAVIGNSPADERLVKKLDGTSTTQTKFGMTDPVYGSLMEGMIRRAPGWERRAANCVGAVDMESYRAWLEKNDGLTMQKAVNENPNIVCQK